MPDAVTVQHLTQRYGDHAALDDLSLRVHPGELFGLLGPNGSGKSTLFRILSTLVRPTSGQVSVFGIDAATDPRGVRRSIGIVFQSPALDLQLTAAENLRHHGHLYGLSGATLNRRIDEALQWADLVDRRRDLVQTFSGGMRRRLEIAKALLPRPKLLLLDEPDTGLDPAARAWMWRTLGELTRDQSMTVVLTTHLLSEAGACDRVAMLDRGRLVECDTPDVLVRSLGGEVIELRTDHPDDAIALIRTLAGVDPHRDQDALRFEHANASNIVPRLLSGLDGGVSELSVRRPTLQDVFLKRISDNPAPAVETVVAGA